MFNVRRDPSEGYKTLVRNKWGIEEGDPLFEVELDVARICSAMSRLTYEVNKPLLEEDINHMQMAYTDAVAKLCELSEYFSESKATLTFGLAKYLKYSGYLDNPKNPQVRLKTNLYNKDFVPSSEFYKLRDSEDVVINQFFEVRKIRHRLKILELYLEKVELFEREETPLYTKYDSTAYDRGLIQVIGQSPTMTDLKKYLIIPKDKVYLEIEIERIMEYITVNYFKDPLLNQAYSSGDSYKHFASLLFNVDKEEVKPNQRRLVKQFFSQRSNPFVGLSRVPDNLLRVVSKNNPLYGYFQNLSTKMLAVREDSTPHGRRIKRPSIYPNYMVGVIADIEKLMIQRVSALIEVLPRAHFWGSFLVEVDKCENLKTVVEDIRVAVESCIPRGWFLPDIRITKYEGTMENSEEL